MSAPTIADIQFAVAGFYGVSILELRSPRRLRKTVGARQVAMYLARTLTSHSFPMIGRHFGSRDHTTIFHACRQISIELEKRGRVAREIDALVLALTSRSFDPWLVCALPQISALDRELSARGLQLAIVPSGSRPAVTELAITRKVNHGTVSQARHNRNDRRNSHTPAQSI